MLGIPGLVLQRMVMPEVERWVTNSGWSGMSFMSCKTSSPDPAARQPLTLSAILLLCVIIS